MNNLQQKIAEMKKEKAQLEKEVAAQEADPWLCLMHDLSEVYEAIKTHSIYGWNTNVDTGRRKKGRRKTGGMRGDYACIAYLEQMDKQLKKLKSDLKVFLYKSAIKHELGQITNDDVKVEAQDYLVECEQRARAIFLSAETFLNHREEEVTKGHRQDK